MPQLKLLVDAAKREDWQFVESNLLGLPFSVNMVTWIHRTGLGSENRYERELAARIVCRFAERMGGLPRSKLYEMLEKDPNKEVRYWLALALKKTRDDGRLVQDALREGQNVGSPSVKKAIADFFK